MANTPKNTNTTKTDAELKKENAELAKKIKELEAAMAKQNEKVAEPEVKYVQVPVSSPVTVNDEDVYITLVSLCNGELNLATEGYGHGEIYTFSRFGESINVSKTDLKKIVRNNKSFTTKGLYYIADDDFIKSEHLKNFYKNIIDCEQMLALLDMDKETFVKIFDTVTDEQKTTIASLLTNKIINGEDVDMNIVKICGDAIGRDLSANAKLAISNKSEIKDEDK